MLQTDRFNPARCGSRSLAASGARATGSWPRCVVELSLLIPIVAACSERYSCETIGLAGESQAHGTLEVNFTGVTGRWQLQTERIFLYSPNDGSGVSIAACDDRGGDVRRFNASIAVPIHDEMPAAVGLEWLLGEPTAGVTFTHCTEEECPAGGWVKLGTIDTRFEGAITSFDPEAAHFSADFSAISTDSWGARLDIRADFSWDSEYRLPPALPSLSGSWLLVPNGDAGLQTATKRLTLVQEGSRITGEICADGADCMEVTGFISRSVFVLALTSEWSAGSSFSQDGDKQELLSKGGDARLIRAE